MAVRMIANRVSGLANSPYDVSVLLSILPYEEERCLCVMLLQDGQHILCIGLFRAVIECECDLIRITQRKHGLQVDCFYFQRSLQSLSVRFAPIHFASGRLASLPGSPSFLLCSTDPLPGLCWQGARSSPSVR